MVTSAAPATHIAVPKTLPNHPKEASSQWPAQLHSPSAVQCSAHDPKLCRIVGLLASHLPLH